MGGQSGHIPCTRGRQRGVGREMAKKHTTDLYDEVAARTGASVSSVRDILSTAYETVEEWVGQGDSVTVVGHGTYERSVITARKYWEKQWPAQYVARFRAGTRLERAVRASRP